MWNEENGRQRKEVRTHVERYTLRDRQSYLLFVRDLSGTNVYVIGMPLIDVFN